MSVFILCLCLHTKNPPWKHFSDSKPRWFTGWLCSWLLFPDHWLTFKWWGKINWNRFKRNLMKGQGKKKPMPLPFRPAGVFLAAKLNRRITKSPGFLFYQKPALFTNSSLSVISRLEVYRNGKESYPDAVSICQNKMGQSLIHPHPTSLE